MELIWITLGILCILAGFFGSFLPVIPGPPISYVGLLLLQLTTPTPFSLQFLLIWAAIVGGIMILDNVIPVYGTKKFGGSAFGIAGSAIGMVVGLFFAPVGLVAGPVIGAFIGELVSGKEADHAMKSAFGSFVGFLAGTLLKVIAAVMMGYYFFNNI